MAAKAITIYKSEISKATLQRYVILAWSAFALIIYFFDEFEGFMMPYEPRRGSSRVVYESVDGTALNAMLTLLIPFGMLLIAIYYTRQLKNFKPQPPTPIMKFSEDGLWYPIFGLFKWDEIWYFSTLHVENSGSDYLILKLIKDEKEIKIETGAFATSLQAIRHHIQETNTNPGLKDAGHLVDDTRYDRNGRPLN